MPTVIGLTGPTGAGKSTVSEFFARHGFAVIDCDAVSKEVETPGSDALKAIVAAFGEGVLCADGSLDRQKLADTAFATPEATEKLNAATHPYIMKAIHEKIDAAAATGVRAILLDAPTLFEAGADSLCDRIIAIVADPKKREQRIIARDKLCPCSACLRLDAGKSDAFYTEHAQDVIINNADKDTLLMRCTEMFHEYIRIFDWKF